MAHADFSAIDETLDLVGQFQQAHNVAYGRAVFPDGLGNIFVGKLKIFNESPISLCLFNWIKIFSLDIFNKRNNQCLFIIYGFYDSGDVLQIQGSCSLKPALTCNDLVFAILSLAYQNRLNNSL